MDSPEETSCEPGEYSNKKFLFKVIFAKVRKVINLAKSEITPFYLKTKITNTN